jgi:hypothetical protein
MSCLTRQKSEFEGPQRTPTASLGTHCTSVLSTIWVECCLLASGLDLRRDKMKHYRPLFFLLLVALSACDSQTSNDDDTTESDDDDEAVDGDGDGVLFGDDCDDGDATSTVVAEDGDCDGELDTADCGPEDPTIYTGAPEVLNDGIDQDCDGGDDITCAGSFNVDEVDTADDILALEYCVTITGWLSIYDTVDLTHLDLLSNLTIVGGTLQIWENTALTQMDGLANLTRVLGAIYIEDNPVLSDFGGLSNLTTVGEELSIEENDALADLDWLANLTSVEGDLYINNNPLLCQDDVDEFVSGCEIGGSVASGNNTGFCP